jgi:hypothetical protein
MTADGARTKQATRLSGRAVAEEHLRGGDPVLGRVIDDVIREAGGVRPMLPPDPARPPDPDKVEVGVAVHLALIIKCG